MAQSKQHEQRFSLHLVDNATGELVQARATSLSQWITMTTLIAGENFPAWIGSFIQVSGGAPVYHEPDLTGASAYLAFDTHNRLILGFQYFGPGGVIYFTDADDNLDYMTVKNSQVYGITEKPLQAKTIFQQGAGGAPSTAFTDTGLSGGETHFIGLYMTKVVTA